ncbi:MAG: TetR/AcrR family transcriptional regulator [Anaerolineae bacterium]|nr:TetR/AcrR family transcriptional regulator [Anaerolineae bacterium]
MATSNWLHIHSHILQLEREDIVTRTFRRLDPERQQIIWDAILDEAADRGPVSINIKQVAERAGVSVGSLYTYFNDRDGMLNFAVTLSARILIESIRVFGPMLAAMPLKDGLAAYVAGALEWTELYLKPLRLFIRATYQGGDPQLTEKLVRPVAAALQDTLRQMLVNAAERGEIRPDVDLEAATRVVYGLAIAVTDPQLLPHLNAYFQMVDDTMPAERVVSMYIKLVLEGIGTKAD